MRSVSGSARKVSDADHNPRILSLCCLYPTPKQPQQGVFVQYRLRSLAELTELRVVAPCAIVRYGNVKGAKVRFGRGWCPLDRLDGRISVRHTWWFYPPFSGGFTPFCLALQLVYPLWRIRREFRFDIIDTHFGFPEGITGALLSSVFGVPFTMTLRGNEPKHSRSWPSRSLMAFALRRAARIFTVSERLRQLALDFGADPARVRTVPNGIDIDVFGPRDQTLCRLKHNLPLDRPLILSAGALVERKGHHRVIEALASLRAGGAAAELVIAGGPGPEGEYEQKLRGLVAQHKLTAAVRFLGAVPVATMVEVMSAVNVLCLSSTNEGWPNVVHEALACGTPVVATDVGAIPDMLGGERYGKMVPVNDPVALREALGEALQKNWDRSTIAAWGQSRSWSQVATEVFAEMKAVAAEHGTGRLHQIPPSPVSKDIRRCIDG
jgi:teichuronic acid biosynthesis glycosyltransferase TuaC